MHDLYNLKEMLCAELEEFGRSGELTLSSLQTIDTLAHACKNVCKIIDHKESDGYSTRRGRDRMGRFVSRDGSDMARRLREMMEEAPDDASRREIQRLADKMERM